MRMLHPTVNLATYHPATPCTCLEPAAPPPPRIKSQAQITFYGIKITKSNLYQYYLDTLCESQISGHSQWDDMPGGIKCAVGEVMKCLESDKIPGGIQKRAGWWDAWWDDMPSRITCAVGDGGIKCAVYNTYKHYLTGNHLYSFCMCVYDIFLYVK